MADQEPADKPTESAEGVFGNLPATRPGSRSPRRDETTSEERRTQPRRAAASEPSPAPPPPEPPPEPPPGAERERAVATAESEPRIASVEDLAWAGIAVAAQAATAGVRFASRALEAARKSIEPPE